MMTKILLVEDHKHIHLSLLESLKAEGYSVDGAFDLHTARSKMNPCPDLMLLDWNLPDGQGLDFLYELRRSGSQVPIIFLTARADLVDKVLGLEAGADDYVTKPFESRELIARIRARLRCRNEDLSHNTNPVGQWIVGPLTMDRIRHKVTFQGRTIELVKKEFDLLALLAESPEKVYSRDEILNKVWGYDIFPTTRTVDTHIMQLRQKTSDDLIETVRSVGYRLRIL